MPIDERQDARQRVDEILREFGVRRVTDDHQQGRFVLNDGGKLVGFVANASVVRERDPAARSDLTEPHVVFAVVGEVIAVSLYREAGIAQDARELEAKIPIGKEDNVQATRLYSTACSISIERRS